MLVQNPTHTTLDCPPPTQSHIRIHMLQRQTERQWGQPGVMGIKPADVDEFFGKCVTLFCTNW